MKCWRWGIVFVKKSGGLTLKSINVGVSLFEAQGEGQFFFFFGLTKTLNDRFLKSRFFIAFFQNP